MSKKKKLVRRAFKDSVFKRDGHKCVFCDATADLDAHHIIDRNEIPNGGYVAENGITLCPQHHEMAEIYHSSEKKSCPEGFHPRDLFIKIKSSKEKALKASKNLLV